MNGHPVTIQWRFDDAEPWYLRIDNGSSRGGARRGAEPGPDARDVLARLASSVSIRGGDPRRAMLRRRLRPHGSLRTLWRMQRIFPR